MLAFGRDQFSSPKLPVRRTALQMAAVKPIAATADQVIPRHSSMSSGVSICCVFAHWPHNPCPRSRFAAALSADVCDSAEFQNIRYIAASIKAALFAQLLRQHCTKQVYYMPKTMHEEWT